MSECTHRSASCQVCGKWVGARVTWSRLWKGLAKRTWRQQNDFYVRTLHTRRFERGILECSGCGLRNRDESSVRERIDGKARCNDCARIWEGVSPSAGREREWKVWWLEDMQ